MTRDPATAATLWLSTLYSRKLMRFPSLKNAISARWIAFGVVSLALASCSDEQPRTLPPTGPSAVIDSDTLPRGPKACAETGTNCRDASGDELATLERMVRDHINDDTGNCAGIKFDLLLAIRERRIDTFTAQMHIDRFGTRRWYRAAQVGTRYGFARQYYSGCNLGWCTNSDFMKSISHEGWHGIGVHHRMTYQRESECISW